MWRKSVSQVTKPLVGFVCPQSKGKIGEKHKISDWFLHHVRLRSPRDMNIKVINCAALFPWLLLVILSFFFFKENHVLLSQDGGGAAAAGGQPSRVHQHVSHTCFSDRRQWSGGLPVRSHASPRWAVLCCTPVRAALWHCFLSLTSPGATVLWLSSVSHPRLRPLWCGPWTSRQGNIRYRSHAERTWSLFSDTLYSGQRHGLWSCSSWTAGAVARLPVRERDQWGQRLWDQAGWNPGVAAVGLS